MNEKWKYVKLKEVADVLDPHPSHRAPKALDVGIAFAGIGDIDEFGNVDDTKARVVSPDVLEQQKAAYELNNNSIGYGRVGTVGKIIYFGDRKRDFALSPTMAIINPKQNINPQFLKAFLPTFDFWSQINSKMTGSTRPSVGIQQMREMLVPIPDNKIQDFIGSTWKVLTNKIETNNKINRNLEQMAQAIWSERFRSIEPNSTLGNWFPVKTGKKDANVAKGGIYPFFSCAQNILFTDDYSFDAKAILLAGNGDFNVKVYSGKFEAYQRTYVLIPNNEKHLGFLYYAIKHYLNKLAIGSRGSVIRFITKGNIENLPVFMPHDEDTFELFNSFIEQIAQNNLENSGLTELRDSLLPRLMSGELSVADLVDTK